MTSVDNNKKVLVAMSGGIDSSMALKFLIDDGYECTACTMNLYDNETAGVNSRTCCSVEDVLDARSICNKFNVKHYTFNFKELFKDKVINKFVDDYLHGFTPNPCIDCNKYMKFEKLFERMEVLNCDYVATGHYARIDFVNGKYLLKKAIDKTKDQSKEENLGRFEWQCLDWNEPSIKFYENLGAKQHKQWLIFRMTEEQF